MLDLQKEIAKKIVEKYDISLSAALVGAIVYGDGAKIAWRFGDDIDLQSTNSKINQMARPRDGSDVLKALEIARDELFTQSSGARRNVAKTLILFVSGTIPRDQRIDDISKQLKEKGINIIVFALDDKIDTKGLSSIASEPSKLITLADPKTNLEMAISKLTSESSPGNNNTYVISRNIQAVFTAILSLNYFSRVRF